MGIENQELSDIFLPSGNITFEQLNAITDFRRLWYQLANWMRAFIYSVVNKNPNLTAVSKRLYEGVPLDFYKTFQVFYGPEISERLLNLISTNILLFWRLINGIVENNTELVNQTTVQLYENVDHISTFLAHINPEWDKARWNSLLTQYISMMIEHILAIIRGQFDQEIAIFGRIENLALIMGSYMARGVIQRGLLSEPSEG